MTIHLSGDREQVVRTLMKAGRYASEDEVIDEALRLLQQRDLKQVEEKKRIEAKLIEGLDSGPSTPMTPEDWDEIEREGRRLIGQRKVR